MKSLVIRLDRYEDFLLRNYWIIYNTKNGMEMMVTEIDRPAINIILISQVAPVSKRAPVPESGRKNPPNPLVDVCVRVIK